MLQGKRSNIQKIYQNFGKSWDEKKIQNFSFFSDKYVAIYMEWLIISQKLLEKVEQLANRNPKKKKIKFKEKTIREMSKIHELFPINRQVQGFRNDFYNYFKD